MDEAIRWYKGSCESQNEWPQFHHVCYWELVWAHQFSRNWWGAHKYANLLFEESKWSRCFYAYQKAAMMCMVQDELSHDQREEQIELMRNVPNWKQKIAGKSLPMEKFAIRKAERFLSQGYFLVLPALEFIYVWNGFKIIKSWAMIEPVFVLVENAMAQLEKEKSTRRFFKEDFCLITLLKGVCLRYMNSPLQAEDCFNTVIAHAGILSQDSYLIPYAMYEKALLLRAQDHQLEAMDALEKAKNDYKDYMLQSRLHFRIHSAQTEIRVKLKIRKATTKNKIGDIIDDDDDHVDRIMPLNQSTSNLEIQEPVTEDEAKKLLTNR